MRVKSWRLWMAVSGVAAVMVGGAVLSTSAGNGSDNADLGDRAIEQVEAPDEQSDLGSSEDVATSIDPVDPIETPDVSQDLFTPPVALLNVGEGKITRFEPDGTTSVIVDDIPLDIRAVWQLRDGSILTAGSDLPNLDSAFGAYAEFYLSRPGEPTVTVAENGFVESVAAPDEPVEEAAVVFGIYKEVLDYYGPLSYDRYNFDLVSGRLDLVERDLEQPEIGEGGNEQIFLGLSGSTEVWLHHDYGEEVEIEQDFDWSEVWFQGADADTLASPTDGRYGPGYPVSYGACRISSQPGPGETMNNLTLSPDGRTLVWKHTEGPSYASELRVLDLETGVDGSADIGPLGRSAVIHLGDYVVLTNLRSTTNASYLVDLKTGEVVEFPDPGRVLLPLEVAVPITSAIPPRPIHPPPPSCPDLLVNIYGWSHFQAGESAPKGTATMPWDARSGRCAVAEPPTEVVYTVAEQGAPVVGMIVARTGTLLETPSGLSPASSVEEVITALDDRLKPSVTNGVMQPDGGGTWDGSLDFVPADPNDQHLGLRFMVEDGDVIEMRAGLVELIYADDSC